MIGIEIAEQETEAGWAAFLRDLRARGLEGVMLAVSDDHLGLKAAISKVLGSPWQRCTVHFIRNMHSHCKKGQRNMVGAALREVFNAENLEDAKERARSVIERLEPSVPKVAELFEAAEDDLLAFYRFPEAHWKKLRSTNNIEAGQQGDRQEKRRGRDLPQRRLGDPADRGAVDRAKRRMAARAWVPLG